MEIGTPTKQRTCTENCEKNLMKTFDNDILNNSQENDITCHPIVESCLQGDNCGDGLAVDVYLRLKLSETQKKSKSSTDYLRGALEILWTRLQQESESSTKSDKETLHMSLFSNSFLGSRCLLVSLLARLGHREEAYEVATSVIKELTRLYEKGAHSENNAKHCNRDCSILFGLAGALQVIWFLRKELNDTLFGRDLALSLSYTILLEGLAQDDEIDIENDNPTLRWKWNGWPYLGAGTGAVGILYALLGHTESEWEELESSVANAKLWIQKTIDELANHRYESSASFSGRGNLKDSLVDFEPDESFSACSWTHGAPGYCLLLLKAFDIYGDERFFFHARDLAESVIWNRWQHPQDKKGSLGLTKGVAGIAYVFLAMARVDWRDRNMWIQRARELATTSLSQGGLSSDEPNRSKSLFDGIGGIASLLIDLERIAISDDEAWEHSKEQNQHLSMSCFPFFESCRAKSLPRKVHYKTCAEDHIFQINNISVTKEKKPQTQICTMKTPAKSYAMSMDETAATHDLTASITTRPPVKLRNKGKMASVLDVSQLTEPSLNEITRQQSFKRNEYSGMLCSESLIIQKVVPKRTTHHRRLLTSTSDFSSSNRVKQPHKASEKGSLQAEKCQHDTYTEFDDDNSVFMTDSVKRIQRAEASWIKHFGTQHDKQQRYPSSSTKSNFRRSVGGFLGVSD